MHIQGSSWTGAPASILKHGNSAALLETPCSWPGTAWCPLAWEARRQRGFHCKPAVEITLSNLITSIHSLKGRPGDLDRPNNGALFEEAEDFLQYLLLCHNCYVFPSTLLEIQRLLVGLSVLLCSLLPQLHLELSSTLEESGNSDTLCSRPLHRLHSLNFSTFIYII